MAAYRYVHRVKYSECTIGNHIYYARYLDLLEAARGELMRAAGAPLLALQESGTIFPVMECRLRYQAPARYDDTLSIEVEVALAHGARLNFGYRITNQAGKPVLEGETFHVCTNLEDKPRRLPAALVAALGPYRLASGGAESRS